MFLVVMSEDVFLRVESISAEKTQAGQGGVGPTEEKNKYKHNTSSKKCLKLIAGPKVSK